MREAFIGHVVVCLDGGLDVFPMNTNSHTHDHVLWTLSDLAAYSEEV
jgi:hypothetical protein